MNSRLKRNSLLNYRSKTPSALQINKDGLQTPGIYIYFNNLTLYLCIQYEPEDHARTGASPGGT